MIRELRDDPEFGVAEIPQSRRLDTPDDYAYSTGLYFRYPLFDKGLGAARNRTDG